MSTSSSANQTGLGSVGAGAAAGAAIGSVVPGVGTVVGASIGAALGGIAGSIGLGKKAKKNAKRAQAVQREREQNAQQATYLQMIRQARMARSGSLAASTAYGLASSSLATSALSSIGSQSQYSVQYTANDQRLVELYNHYMKKAGSYAKSAQTTLAAGQLASMALGTYAAFAGAGAAAGTAVGDTTTLGATEITEAMMTPQTAQSINALYSSTYASTLANNLGALGMWSVVSQPIFTGVSRYNQI